MAGGSFETYRALVVLWSFERKRHKNPHCNTACLKNGNVISVTNCSKALYNYCALSKLSSRRAFSAIEYSVDCLETCLFKKNTPSRNGWLIRFFLPFSPTHTCFFPFKQYSPLKMCHFLF